MENGIKTIMLLISQQPAQCWRVTRNVLKQEENSPKEYKKIIWEEKKI